MTRNSAHLVKSEDLVYPNVDAQGRSQAQLRVQNDPNLDPQDPDGGDESYIGGPDGDDDDDDADASGEPDFEDDEEADPMNLQPGDVLDGGVVPALTASQEDAEGEEEDEDELSECVQCYLFLFGASRAWWVWLGGNGWMDSHVRTSDRTIKEESSRSINIIHSTHPKVIERCPVHKRKGKTFSLDISFDPIPDHSIRSSRRSARKKDRR